MAMSSSPNPNIFFMLNLMKGFYIPGTRRVPGFVEVFLLPFCKKCTLLCGHDLMCPDSYY